MKTMSNSPHVKFLFDFIYSNKIKFAFIFIMAIVITIIITYDSTTRTKFIKLIKLPDKSYYAQTSKTTWRVVHEYDQIHGNYIQDSNIPGKVMACTFVLLIIFLFIICAKDKQKYGWDLYKLIGKHYSYLVNEIEVYSITRNYKYTIYTINDYYCHYNDHSDREYCISLAFQYYFESKYLVKYHDVQKNRTDTINSIINE